MLKRLGIIGFTAAVLLIWVVVAGTFDILNVNHGHNPDETASQTKIGGAFSLTDSSGKRVTNADFKGKYMLVYFGFSSCPDVCPNDLTEISHVMEGLGANEGKVVPVFITVDPERDTPAKLKEYSKSFNPNIVYLTGNKEEIEQAIKNYKAYSEKVENKDKPEEYMMNHTSFIYFMDKNGEYITHFTDDDEEDKVLQKVKEVVLK